MMKLGLVLPVSEAKRKEEKANLLGDLAHKTDPKKLTREFELAAEVADSPAHPGSSQLLRVQKGSSDLSHAYNVVSIPGNFHAVGVLKVPTMRRLDPYQQFQFCGV